MQSSHNAHTYGNPGLCESRIEQQPKPSQNFSTRGSPTALPARDRTRIDPKLSCELLLRETKTATERKDLLAN